MLTAQVLIAKDFEDALATIQRQLGNLDGVSKDILANVGPVDKVQNTANFATEGAASGDTWAPLSARYAAAKRKAVGSKKILVYSGDLRNASTNAGHPDRRVFMASGVVNLGTAHRLAAVHQFGARGSAHVKPHHRNLTKASAKQGRGAGGRRGQVRGYSRKVNLPARPMIRKSEAQHAAIMLAIKRGILIGMAKQTRGIVSRSLREAANAISLRGL